jgi:hypothetical protein
LLKFKILAQPWANKTIFTAVQKPPAEQPFQLLPAGSGVAAGVVGGASSKQRGCKNNICQRGSITLLGVELHSPLLAGLKQICARPIRGPARGGGAAINCALSIQ